VRLYRRPRQKQGTDRLPSAVFAVFLGMRALKALCDAVKSVSPGRPVFLFFL